MVLSVVWTAAADPRGKTGTSETADFSPNGQFIVSGAGDGKVRLWRVSDASLVWETAYWTGSLNGARGEIEAVSFSPDGQVVAVGGNSDGVKIYRTSNGSLVTDLQGEGTDGLAFSPDGTYFAGPTQERLNGDLSDVRMFDPATWALRYSDRISHEGDINSIDFTKDGQLVLTASQDRTVKISRVADGSLVRTIRAAINTGNPRATGSVKSVRLSPDGQLIATANGNENNVKIFRFDDGSLVTTLPHEDIVETVAFSPDGRFLATGGGGSEDILPGQRQGLRLYRVSDFSLVEERYTEHSQGVEYIDFTADSRYMVTASEDGTIKLWSVESSGTPVTPVVPGVRLVGTNRPERLQGQGGNDRIAGLGGNDVLFGLEGNDVILGGRGRDRLFGNDGDDRLSGATGNDRLFGGDDNDVLIGSTGNDFLSGGTGRDRLYGREGNDQLRGDSGDDRLVGDTGNDVLLGGGGKDLMRGGLGRDRYVYTNINERGDRILDFNPAIDVIDIQRLINFDASNFSDVIRLQQLGSQTVVSVDIDGNAEDNSFVDLLTLSRTSVGTLSDRNFLI
jgi:WD40 repeat protein